MTDTKNLCAQIPIALHEQVSEERERLGQTTSEYITNLIQEYYNMIENQKGGINMMEKGRTMAFQIPEEFFQRIKQHLERETLRLGRKYTQREFVLSLITEALDEADTEYGSESRESEPDDTAEIAMPDTADTEDAGEADGTTADTAEPEAPVWSATTPCGADNTEAEDTDTTPDYEAV